MRTCDWSRKLFSLVGHEGEDVNSDEADEKAENDRPQDEAHIPAARANLLKDKGVHGTQNPMRISMLKEGHSTFISLFMGY